MENLTDENFKNKYDFLKPIILIVVLIILLTLVKFSPVGEYFKPSKLHLLKERFSHLHSLAPFVFILVSAILISIGIPRSSISILGGMVFGFVIGTLLSTFSALIGSIVTFYLVRYLGRPYFYRKFGNKVRYLEEKVRQNSFLVVVLLRQSPLTCMLVNVLIGLSPIKTSSFILASLVGFLPEAAVFTLFGSSVRENFYLRITFATFFLITLIIIIRIIYKRSQLAKEIHNLFKKNEK